MTNKLFLCLLLALTACGPDQPIEVPFTGTGTIVAKKRTVMQDTDYVLTSLHVKVEGRDELAYVFDMPNFDQFKLNQRVAIDCLQSTFWGNIYACTIKPSNKPQDE